MENYTDLLEFESTEVETIETCGEQTHNHITMGDGNCTLCTCLAFTDSGDGVTCSTYVQGNPGDVCGHTRGLHLDPEWESIAESPCWINTGVFVL